MQFNLIATVKRTVLTRNRLKSCMFSGTISLIFPRKYPLRYCPIPGSLQYMFCTMLDNGTEILDFLRRVEIKNSTSVFRTTGGPALTMDSHIAHAWAMLITPPEVNVTDGTINNYTAGLRTL
jgi:hypothetical protein